VEAELSTTLIGEGRSLRLLVAGEIDLATYRQFDQAIVEATRLHGRVLLDLSKVELVASVGIRVIYTHLDQIVAVLVSPGSIISRALTIAGLDVVIPVNPDSSNQRPCH
jgi:anti-anti-sigma factor